MSDANDGGENQAATLTAPTESVNAIEAPKPATERPRKPWGPEPFNGHPKGGYALAQAASLRVHPLPENAKEPPVTDFGHRARSARTERGRRQIEWWWQQHDYNIGVATGPGGEVIVLDVDTKDGKPGLASLERPEREYDLPQSYRVRTPSGGIHVYLRLPPKIYISNSTSWLPEELGGIDIRGNEHQAYVLGAGSSIDGKPYVAIGSPKDIADCPEKLLKLIETAATAEIETRKRKLDPACDLDMPINFAIADQIVRDADDAPQGDRNNSAFRLASVLKDQGLSFAEVLDRMVAWSDKKCFPPLDDDELERTVSSAYYSGNAPGSRASFDPCDEFEPIDIGENHGPKTRKMFLLSGADLACLPKEPVYLVDGLIEREDFIVDYGVSGVGKSFVLIDRALRIAAGLPWFGHETKQAGVVYVAAEGQRGLRRRVIAWCKAHNVEIETLPFAIMPCPIDLRSNTSDTQELIDLIKHETASWSCRVGYVVIDTLSRTFGGGDENSSVDMSTYVLHADQIKEALHAAINIVHHAGKDAARGARGHSCLKAATDAEFSIENPGVIRNTKVRDGKERGEMAWFSVEDITLGTRSNGRPLVAGVLRPKSQAQIEFSAPTSEAELNLDTIDREYLADIRQVARKQGAVHVSRRQMEEYWKVSKATTARRLVRLTKAGVLIRTGEEKYTWLCDPGLGEGRLICRLTRDASETADETGLTPVSDRLTNFQVHEIVTENRLMA